MATAATIPHGLDIKVEEFDKRIPYIDRAIERLLSCKVVYFSLLVLLYSVHIERRCAKSLSKLSLEHANNMNGGKDEHQFIKRVAIQLNDLSLSLGSLLEKTRETTEAAREESAPFVVNLLTHIKDIMEETTGILEDTAETLALSLSDDFVNLVIKETENLQKT